MNLALNIMMRQGPENVKGLLYPLYHGRIDERCEYDQTGEIEQLYVLVVLRPNDLSYGHIWVIISA